MGLVTSKTAEATYQHKGDYALSSDLQGYQLKGNYVTQEELNSFSPTNLNVANGFNAPKANATLYGVTLDSGGISSMYKDGKINVNNELVVKGDNVVTFKKIPGMEYGSYISNSPAYDPAEGGRGGKTEGNAIISLESEGILAMQSLDGRGDGSTLSLRKNGDIVLGKSDVNFSLKKDQFCFRDTKNNVCLTASDLASLKSQSGQTPIPMGVTVAPSKYLRTRNYMDY